MTSSSHYTCTIFARFIDQQTFKTARNFHSRSTLVGLLSPGLSVPLQVPGGAGQFQDHSAAAAAMGSMTSQYWPRLQ